MITNAKQKSTFRILSFEVACFQRKYFFSKVTNTQYDEKIQKKNYI